MGGGGGGGVKNLAPLGKGSCGSNGVPSGSQKFQFLNIHELLNSAILCKFYFLKFYLVLKTVIRNEPRIKTSKKGNAKLPYYCYRLSTCGTAGAKKQSASWEVMDASIWLSLAC